MADEITGRYAGEMTKEFHYVLPVGQTDWKIEGTAETVLRWDYDVSRGEALSCASGPGRWIPA
jgi:hypothetical protein